MITYFQALILGLVQGITELFPISSLGHSVLIADLFNWHGILHAEVGGKKNFFLVFLVVIHVATALALLFYYRRQWLAIAKGFLGSCKTRSLNHPDAKLAWLLIAATIPAGLVGFLFQNILRTQFAKPLNAIVFISINGFLLLLGDRYIAQHGKPRTRQRDRTKVFSAASSATKSTADKLTLSRAMIIGSTQIFALIAGISRSGVTMIGGIYSGLNHEEAARFSFLLATPIILAAGIYQLPEIVGPSSNGLHGQMIVGAVTAAAGAYCAVRYLDRYFKRATLRPFGLYCIGAGVFMLSLGIIRGHF